MNAIAWSNIYDENPVRMMILLCYVNYRIAFFSLINDKTESIIPI
jgi:hypothetical protein